MTNKDTEARALLDALCAWLIEDAKFMPSYVDKLRDKFEAATTSRGTFQRDRGNETEGRSKGV